MRVYLLRLEFTFHYRTISPSKGSQMLRLFLLLDFASSFVFNLSFLRDSARTLGNLTLSLPLSPTTFLFNTPRQDVLMSH
nr:MAG TPA: hypothetical protein [Caudoviricetes sp.]